MGLINILLRLFFSKISYVNLFYGFVISFVFAAIAYIFQFLSIRGALVGIIGGALIYSFLGFSGLLIPLTFFILGSGTTLLRFKIKGGAIRIRRGARHAIANCFVGGFFAFLAVYTKHYELFVLSFVGSFAATASDTASSELGQIYGRNPRLITNLKKVKAGTDGAITSEGTILGIIASLFIAMIALLFDLINMKGFWIIIIAAFIGNTVDSLLGATLERKKLIGNETVNFFCTLSAGMSCLGLWLL